MLLSAQRTARAHELVNDADSGAGIVVQKGHSTLSPTCESDSAILGTVCADDSYVLSKSTCIPRAECLLTLVLNVEPPLNVLGPSYISGPMIPAASCTDKHMHAINEGEGDCPWLPADRDAVSSGHSWPLSPLLHGTPGDTSCCSSTSHRDLLVPLSIRHILDGPSEGMNRYRRGAELQNQTSSVVLSSNG